MTPLARSASDSRAERAVVAALSWDPRQDDARAARRALLRDLGCRGELGVAAVAVAHLGALALVARYGDEAARERWLEPALEARLLATVANQGRSIGIEREAGEQISFQRTGDGIVLTGATPPCANALAADYAIVVAEDLDRPARVALVVVELAGSVLIERRLDGLAPARTATIALFGTVLPEGQVLAYLERPDPRLVALAVEDRLLLCEAALGLARAAVETTLDFVMERRMGDGVLSDMQVTRHRLADLVACREMAEALHTAVWPHRGDGAREIGSPADALMSLLVTCEALHEIVDGCLQLLGGRGFLMDSWLAGVLLDVLALPELLGSVPGLQDAIAVACDR